MRRRPSGRALGIATTVAMTSALAGSPFLGAADASGTRRVHIANIAFSAAKLSITRGTTVRWTFEDADTPHNVTSRGRKHFRSSRTQKSGSYSVRFTKPGTYSYVCTIHFNMKGRIVVR